MLYFSRNETQGILLGESGTKTSFNSHPYGGFIDLSFLYSESVSNLQKYSSGVYFFFG